jgi:hypothetical protein
VPRRFKVSPAVGGRGAGGGGDDQLFRTHKVEPAAVARMGVCCPNWGAGRLGVLSHALFYTLTYLAAHGGCAATPSKEDWMQTPV